MWLRSSGLRRYIHWDALTRRCMRLWESWWLQDHAFQFPSLKSRLNSRKLLKVCILCFSHYFSPPFNVIHLGLPNLKEANFSHSLFLTNELVGFVVDHCPQIESLNLWNCLTISDSALRHISRLENLRWLNVGDNPNFTAEGLTEIVDKCNKLTHLELTLCPKVGPIGTINKLAYSIAN